MYELYDIAMVSADDGWIVGEKGRIYHFRKGVWEKVGDPHPYVAKSGYLCLPETLIRIQMHDAETGWILGHEGTVLTLISGSWVRDKKINIRRSVSDFQMFSAEEGWMAGDGIIHYRKGDCERDEDVVPHIDSISMLSSSEGWAVTNDGPYSDEKHCGSLFYKYFRQAPYFLTGTWSKVKSPVPREGIFDMKMVSSYMGWAVTGHGSILKYDGDRWVVATSEFCGKDIVWCAMALISPEEWCAVGWGGILHHCRGAYRLVEQPRYQGIYGVSMISSEEGWAVGKDDLILRCSGGKWEVYDLPDKVAG